MKSMTNPGKLVVVTQHYPPDRSTTAAIFSAIAKHLAIVTPVLVISGSSGSARLDETGQLSTVEISNWMPAKGSLVKRAIAETLFSIRIFLVLLTRMGRDDVALTVTAPFMLPYAVVAAAKLKRGRSALIVHDLFPDALVIADVIGLKSLVAKVLHIANWMTFRALDSIIVIGRDAESRLLRYGEAIREKITFIPNWITLTPAVRPICVDNPYRQACQGRFVIGLSGNLGLTHDPLVVFEAARILRDDRDLHFLLSGWGIGFELLRAKQADARLPNVTFVDRVEEGDLENLLAAADVWIIPYRKDVIGVSTPSRFYNLMAVGRPVVLVSEPGSEAALIVREANVGWVVTPGNPDELAKALRAAFSTKDLLLADRAVSVAKCFTLERAMKSYATLLNGLLANPDPSGDHS
jgi:colanic acid biosynthesis glycosyl transferase WcaI